MMTLQQVIATVQPTADGTPDWDAQDAAHLAWLAASRAETRRVARWYGLALAGMDRLPRNRRTVDTIRRDFAVHLRSLATFDTIAADALRREVSDLMAFREENPRRDSHAALDPSSDPDAAFDSGYECGQLGWPDSPPPAGYDVHERRAFYLGLSAAAVDLIAEGGAR